MQQSMAATAHYKIDAHNSSRMDTTLHGASSDERVPKEKSNVLQAFEGMDDAQKLALAEQTRGALTRIERTVREVDRQIDR